MIVLMRQGAPREEVERLKAMLAAAGCEVREADSGVRCLILADKRWEQPPMDLISRLKASDCVEHLIHADCLYPLVAADESGARSRVRVRDAVFGADGIELIAGPCTVESYDVLLETARRVQAAGAKLLRGGAFKPTTSPYSFQGRADEALELLKAVREETGMGVVTEVMEPRRVAEVADAADMLQVGARSMQNFDLLREVGRQEKPVLLKRSMGATVDEWLCAAEYVALEGNEKIVLCERGIRTFESSTRATLDVGAIAVVRSRSRLPVIADPSHAAGERRYVQSLALAAVAAGAHGLLVEVHPRPEQAVKDGAQTISTQAFAELAERAFSVADALCAREAVAAK